MVESREAKRLNNEGSATEIGKGTDKWKVRVCIKNPATGTTERFSRTIQLEKKRGGWSDRAREKRLNDEIAKLRGEKEKELALKGGGGDGTLSTLAEKWLKHVQQSGRVGPPTVAMYRRRLTNHVLPRLGHLPANRVGALELDSLYEEMLEQGLAPSTVAAVHTTVIAMLRQAKRWKMITELPEATPPSAQSPEVEPPTPEQVWALIDKAEEQNLPHIALLIRLAALTGARRGELLAIHWSDVDIDNSTLWIRGSLIYTKESGIVLGPTKTKRVRKVHLDPVMNAVIQNQVLALKDACAKLEIAHVDDPWLFFGEIDGSKPLFPDSVSSAFRRVTKKLGIEQFHFHSLRHFTATQLIAAGVDIRTVSGRLGHSDPSVTLRVYSHVLEDNDRAASDIMGRLLEP